MLLCEPSNAPVVYSGIKTEYTTDGSITKESHPVFRSGCCRGGRLVKSVSSRIYCAQAAPAAGLDTRLCDRAM